MTSREGGGNVMEMPVVFLLLLHFSLNGPEESHAVNPGCTCLVFSQTYGKERGTFSSPDYPKNYPRGLDCLLYTFIAGPDQIVELTFADFDVHKTHMDCMRGDYLKLFPHVERGEVSEYSEGAGVLCGGRSATPPALYSSARAFVLEFHSAPGRAANATGFLGYFKFIDRKLFLTDGQKIADTACDFQFLSAEHSSPHGRFYSPRYPSSYPKNVRCSYRFRARLKERIRIVFEEVTLQKGDISCLNRADIIKVFDGRNSFSSVITFLCNEGSEIEILSTGSDLYVEFTANSDWPGQGFKASFQFQPLEEIANSDAEKNLKLLANHRTFTVIGPEVSATNIQSTTVKTEAVSSPTSEGKSVRRGAILCTKQFTSSCDAVFNSDSSKNGSLTSPHYPSSYPARSHCRYDFQGRGKERLQITFQDFNLYHPTDDSKECDSIDALQAFVHIDGRMEKIDSFCGSTVPRSIMSNGPRMMLEFRGIYSSRYIRGFKAFYSFTENYGITQGKQLPEFPCGFVYNSSEAGNGSFSSPNYPGPYPRDTECHYFFHGTHHQKVHLHFTYFDVEGVLPCEAISASDYVEFSNFMARDRKYNRYCGQLKEFHIESDRKFFRVTFRSNDRLDGTGFKANYQFLDEVESYSIKPDIGNTANILETSLICLTVLFALATMMAVKTDHSNYDH